MNQLYLFTIVGYSCLNLSTSPKVNAELFMLNLFFSSLNDLFGSYLSTWNSIAILAKHNSQIRSMILLLNATVYR